MKNRTIQIYMELYNGPKSKEYFAHFFDITTKSVENMTKKLRDDIVFDRKLSQYRYKELLPKYIPFELFFTLFQNSIGNQVIKNDILSVGRLLSSQAGTHIYMIETDKLSKLSQRIIMGYVGIKSNCVLKIEYTGNNKPIETKYIRPHHITATGYIYYLYSSYDKKNKKNIGDTRSFAFNAVHSIEVVEYLTDVNLSIDGEGNAYGMINYDKYVLLRLESNAASFFKREQQFERTEFEFISEDYDGSVLMKMFYNNTDEIKHLIQGWMPQIKIEENTELKESIYGQIQSSCNSLVQDIQENNKGNI